MTSCGIINCLHSVNSALSLFMWQVAPESAIQLLLEVVAGTRVITETLKIDFFLCSTCTLFSRCKVLPAILFQVSRLVAEVAFIAFGPLGMFLATCTCSEQWRVQGGGGSRCSSTPLSSGTTARSVAQWQLFMLIIDNWYIARTKNKLTGL